MHVHTHTQTQTHVWIANYSATSQVRPVRIPSIIVSMVTASSLISGFNLGIMGSGNSPGLGKEKQFIKKLN